MSDKLFTDTEARVQGTWLVMEPFLHGRNELESMLLLFIAERHGATAAVQLLLTWENEEKKWSVGQGEFQ